MLKQCGAPEDVAEQALPGTASCCSVAAQFTGARSSTLVIGQPGNKQNRSRRYVHGSMRCIAQLASNETKTVLTRPPSSEPTNSQFLRLCGGLHNRNYADRRIMRSRSERLVDAA